MVISHVYKYIFIQIPRTGTTAISKELCANYKGEKVLEDKGKHANYKDFIREYGDKYKDYFVFASVRNPLDRTVSLYYKIKTDHKNRYSKRSNKKKKKISSKWFDDRYNKVVNNNYTFNQYFLKFYYLPYVDMSVMEKNNCNYVIRYENLQEDFSEVLRLLNIEQKRPVPIINKTKLRDYSFYDYYTKDCIPRAKRVFGVFMSIWGYTFPTSWGMCDPSFKDKLLFELVYTLKKLYWIHLKRIL